MNSWNGRSRGRSGHRITGAVIVTLLLGSGASACGGGEQDRPAPSPHGSPAVSTETPPAADPVSLATHTKVGVVAGRIGENKRRRIKKVIGGVVERYLEGGFTGGTYPRSDFSTALVDFREGAVSDATHDLGLLTNQDIGAQISSVTATHRRLRIDLLAPEGRMSAATARFVLAFDTSGEVAQSERVAGSLFLTNQQGAWKVFGYDIHKGVQP